MPVKRNKNNKKKKGKKGVASRSQSPEESSVSISPAVGNSNSGESTIRTQGASGPAQSEPSSSESESESPTPTNEIHSQQTEELQAKDKSGTTPPSESSQEKEQPSNVLKPDPQTPTSETQRQILAQDTPIIVENLQSSTPEVKKEQREGLINFTGNTNQQPSQTPVPPASNPSRTPGPPVGLDDHESLRPLFPSSTSSVAGPSAMRDEGLSPGSTEEGEDSDSVNSAVVSAMERVKDPDEERIGNKYEEKISPTRSLIEFDPNNPLGITFNETSFKGFDEISRDPATGTSPNLSEQSTDSGKKFKDIAIEGQSGVESSPPPRDLAPDESGSHVQRDSTSPIPKITINDSPDPPSPQKQLHQAPYPPNPIFDPAQSLSSKQLHPNFKDLSTLHSHNKLNSKEDQSGPFQLRNKSEIEEILDVNDRIIVDRLGAGPDQLSQSRETKIENSPQDFVKTTSSMAVETSDWDGADGKGQHGEQDIYIASGNEGQMDNAPFEDLTRGESRPPIQGTSSSRRRQDEAAGRSATALTFKPQTTTTETLETRSESSLHEVPEEQPDRPRYEKLPLPDPQTNTLPQEHEEVFGDLVRTLESEARSGKIQSENGEVSYDGFNFYIEWGTRYQDWDINVSHRPAGKQRSDGEFWPAMRLVRRLFGDERLKYHLNRWLESEYNVFNDNRLPRFENEVDRREFEPLLDRLYQFVSMERREEPIQSRNEQRLEVDSLASKSPKSPKSEKSENTASTESSLGSPITKVVRAGSRLDFLTRQRSILKSQGQWTEELEEEYMDACNKMERVNSILNRELSATGAAESDPTQPVAPNSTEPGSPGSQEGAQHNIDDTGSRTNTLSPQAENPVSLIRSEPGSPDSQATALPIINSTRPTTHKRSTQARTEKPAAFNLEQIDQLQRIQSELDILEVSENSLNSDNAPYELPISRTQRKARLKGKRNTIYSSISKAGVKSWKENLFRQKWDALEKEQDELEEEKHRCEGISSREKWTKEDRLREVLAQLEELANDQSSSSDTTSPRSVYYSLRARAQIAPEFQVPSARPRRPPFESPPISAVPGRLGAARPPPSTVQNEDPTPQPLNISLTKRPRPLRVPKEKSPAPSRRPTTQDAVKKPMEDPVSPRSHGPQPGGPRANETAAPKSEGEKKSDSPKKGKSQKKSPASTPSGWRGYLPGFSGSGASPTNPDGSNDSNESNDGKPRLDFNSKDSDTPPSRGIDENFETVGEPSRKLDSKAEAEESAARGRTQERGGGRRENPVDASHNEVIDNVAPHHEHFHNTNIRVHTDIQLPPVQYFGQEGPDPLHDRADTLEEEAEARLRILDQAEGRTGSEKINPRRTSLETPDSVWLFMRGLPRRQDISRALREEIQAQFEHLKDAANQMMVERIEENRKRVEAEAALKECQAGRSGKAAEKVEKNKWDEQLQKKDDQIEKLKRKLVEAREYGRAQEEKAKGEKERAERQVRARQTAEALAQNLRNEKAAEGAGRKESQRSVQRASGSGTSGFDFDSHYASSHRSPGGARDQLRPSSLNLGRKPSVSSEVAVKGKYHRRTISLILSHHISSLAPFINRERWSIAQKRAREIYNFWHDLPDDDPRIISQEQQNSLLGRVYFWIGVLEWRERRNQQAWENFEHAGWCMGAEQCQEADWLDVYRAQLMRERQTDQETMPLSEIRFVNTADSTPDLSGPSRPSRSS